MFFRMDHKKSVHPNKIAFLRARRTVWNSHGNQIFSANIWEFFTQPVFIVLHRFVAHFIASSHARMISPERFGARELMLPLNLNTPKQFEAVTKTESQSIGFLPVLPFINVWVSCQHTDSAFNRLNSVFFESLIRMLINE